MAAYQRQTFQVFRSKTSTSVATRNQRIAALNAKKYGPNSDIPDDRTMPAELGVYAKQLVCTHEGKPRSRGKGVRRQSLRATDCPATINALAKRRHGGDSTQVSGWQVVVTRHVPFHNHPLDRHTFMAFSRTFAPRPESVAPLPVDQGLLRVLKLGVDKRKNLPKNLQVLILLENCRRRELVSLKLGVRQVHRI